MTPTGNIPPGFKLLHKLHGHTKVIRHIAWSPDGRTLASASEDGTLRLWDTDNGKGIRKIEGKNLSKVKSITWSPDGQTLAIASGDTTVRLWNTQSGQQILILVGHTDTVNDVAWSPNNQILASASRDQTIRLWNTKNGEEVRVYERYANVYRIAWSPDGQTLAADSGDKKLLVWDVESERNFLEAYHIQRVSDFAWSSDSSTIATACDDGNIMFWYRNKVNFITILEGHTDAVVACSFSSDGDWLASRSLDRTMRLWHTKTLQSVAIIQPITSLKNRPPALVFHPKDPTLLATLGEDAKVIHIWELDYDLLLANAPIKESVFYTTAKIALVGDSGVGKSGLGYRIAKDKFHLTGSTHGQQFWVVDELGKIRSDGTQCEAVLWDFAGQPDYRLVHSMFLRDIDLGLVLFDPSRYNTLKGVEYWLKQLGQKEQICRAVLVGARMDVSNLTLTRQEIEAFCQENGISGGFIATSAKRGDGIPELMDIIREQIDWESKPTTVTTETFKRIKDYVLALKTDTTHQGVLVTPRELRQRLEAMDSRWEFSDAEMMTAVGHLQNHGYLMILPRGSDNVNILLSPDILINLASSFVVQARRNEKGLGALEEERVLKNDYNFPELEMLNTDERDALLNATTELLFLKHNVCFRETLDGRTFLVFPDLITERPPNLTDDRATMEDVSYIVSGAVENIYAALVVLLGYAPTFKRTNQWRNQAQYETIKGAVCGFRQTNDLTEELELVLYYSKDLPDYLRSRFQGLFEEILHGRDVEVMRYPPLECPHCGYRQERTTVIRRVRQGRDFVNCEECGEKITLPKAGERIKLSRGERAMVTREQVFSQMRTTYETALVRVKSLMRDTPTPSCFISYAWGMEEHQRWVWDLATHLNNAGLEVYFDRWDAPVGTDVMRFMSMIEDGSKMNFVLPIGTPLYREKYENQNPKTGTAVAAEVNLINVRLARGTESERNSILPVLLDGSDREALPPMMRNLIFADFRNEATYFVSLFDLVLRMYGISFEDPAVSDLRMKLYEEAQSFPS